MFYIVHHLREYRALHVLPLGPTLTQQRRNHKMLQDRQGCFKAHFSFFIFVPNSSVFWLNKMFLKELISFAKHIYHYSTTRGSLSTSSGQSAAGAPEGRIWGWCFPRLGTKSTCVYEAPAGGDMEQCPGQDEVRVHSQVLTRVWILYDADQQTVSEEHAAGEPVSSDLFLNLTK